MMQQLEQGGMTTPMLAMMRQHWLATSTTWKYRLAHFPAGSQRDPDRHVALVRLAVLVVSGRRSFCVLLPRGCVVAVGVVVVVGAVADVEALGAIVPNAERQSEDVFSTGHTHRHCRHRHCPCCLCFLFPSSSLVVSSFSSLTLCEVFVGLLCFV